LDGVFLYSKHSLCPNSGVWAEPSWFPFRQWLALACNSRRGKQIALWCLSLLEASLFHALSALPFFSLRVSSFQLFQTLLRAITMGLSGVVKGGVGRLLAGWSKTCAPKHTHHTLCSKYYKYLCNGSSVVTALIRRFYFNCSAVINFASSSLIAFKLLRKHENKKARAI